MSEVWRVSRFDPTIEVSNKSQVRRTARVVTAIRNGERNVQSRPPSPLRPWVAKTGYLTVQAKTGTSRRKYLVHRLVAAEWVPGYAPELTVNHRDGNKLNNRLSNLEWITTAENTSHQWSSGLIDLRGEGHPGHKLTESDVIAIRASTKTLVQIGAEFGISDGMASMIRTRRRWAHIA